MADGYSEQIGLRLTGDASSLKAAMQDGGGAVNKFAQTTSSQLNSATMSAKQLQFALRGIPAQFTDIVVSLQSGQRPLTVLLQQGGQLKDMFGGIGPAAKAMGGYVAGLVNPFTLAAAAVGVLTYAYIQGSKEQDNYAKALILSGNAAGTTTGQLADLARQLAQGSYTQSKAAETLAAMAQSGAIATDQLQAFSAAAIDWERATSTAVGKTVDQFKELAKSPLEASVKLNGEIHHLTASVYEQIRSLEQHGRTLDAGRLAMAAYADALAERSKQIRESNGFLETSWNGVASFAKKAWDAMLGIGRDQTGSEQLAALKKRLADRLAAGPFHETQDLYDQTNAGLRNQIALLERLNAQLDQQAKKQADTNRQLELRTQWDKQGEEFLSKRQQLERELSKVRTEGQQLLNAGLITEADLRQRIANVRNKYNDNTGQGEVAEINARIQTQRDYNARLAAQIQSGVALDQPVKLTEAEQRVVKIQRELETSLTSVARAQKEKALAAAQDLVGIEKETVGLERQKRGLQDSQQGYRQLVTETGNQAQAIDQQAAAQEAANATFGKSKTAIEEMVLAQLKAKQAEIDLHEEAYSPEYIAAINAKAVAQERWVKALQEGEYHALNAKLTENGRQAQEETASLQLEVSLLGLTREQRERIVAVRKVEVDLAKQLAEIDRSNAPDAKKEELRAQARANAQVAAQNAATKAILDEWNRTADQINQSLTDALMRGFESGKGYAQNLRDAIKSMFGTLVLRPVIQAVMAPVSGALGGVFSGLPGSMGSSLIGSTAGSFLSSSATSLLGSGSFLGNMFAGASGVGGSFASTVGAGLATDAMGASVAEGTAAATLGGASTLGASLMAAAPYLAVGALVVSSLLKSGGGPKADGQYNPFTKYAMNVGISPDQSQNGTAVAAAQALQAQYNAVMSALGGTANMQFGVGVSTDPKGTAQSMVQVDAGKGGTAQYESVNLKVGRDDASLQAAIASQSLDVLLKALKGSNLDKPFAEFFSGIADTATSAEKTAALKTAQEVAAYTGSVRDLGGVFDQLTHLSVQTRGALIDAAGGLQALSQATSSYYDNFYTDTEKRLITAQQIAATLSGAGLSVSIDQVLSATRQEFRALVDSLNLTTESGQRGYVALMNVSGAFASITQPIQDTTAALNQSTQAVQNLGQSLQQQLDGAVNAWLSGEELRSYRIYQIQRALAGTDLSYTPEQIGAATRDQIKDLFKYLLAIGDTKAADAMLSVSSALLEITQPAEDASKALQDAAKALQDAGKGVHDFIQQLITTRAGTASPADLLSNTRADYLSDLSKARMGDLTATQHISSSAQAYIDAQKAFTASGGNTQAVISQVISELQSLPATKSYEQQSLESLNGIIGALEALPSNLTSVLSPELASLIADKFKAIDLNGNGITFDELQVALAGKATDGELHEIFTALDTNGDGTISLLEALGGKADTANLTSQQVLNRLLQDSMLSFPAAAAGKVFNDIAVNTGIAANWLAQIAGHQGITGLPAVTGAPSGSTSATTSTATGDLLSYTTGGASDADKLAAEMAAYNAAKASGMSLADAAAQAGYSTSDVDRFLATTGLPRFANGGNFSGGWRVVGERGWELEHTGPSRIFNQSQARSLVDTSRLEARVDELTATVRRLLAVTADAANKTIQAHEAAAGAATAALTEQARQAARLPAKARV
jgi:phage-related minor tail protein